VTQRFHLVTNWQFDAPVDAVWAHLTDPKSFPTWWPGFERAEVEGDGGVGTVSRYLVRGDFGLRFNLETTVVDLQEPQSIRLTSTGGLVGTGVWWLHADGPRTKVTYVWEVEPSNPFLRLLARIPFVRRRMERSHDGVMTAGGENLARLLAARATDRVSIG
jgi:uncharacterized protein YndB with AHSA1/START domain